MLTNNCGRSLLAESGIVMSRGFLNLLTRVRHFNCCLLLCFELLHMCCRGCKRSFYPVFVLASGQRALLWWGKNTGRPSLTRQTKILSSAPHRCRPFYPAVLPTFPGHNIIYIIYMPTARLITRTALREIIGISVA